jgi:MFS family permease
LPTAPQRSPLLPIFLIVVVDVLGMTIILPLLPYYAERYGASPLVVGLLGATFAVCQLVSGPILGQISDRVGRKPLLLVSQLGTLGGFILLSQAHSLGLIFLSRAIDGITAGNLSLAQAYISDVTEPENRAKSFALIGIAFGIGFLIGPAISGQLAHYDYRYPIYAAQSLSALSILTTLALLPRALPHAAPTDGEPAGRRLALFSWGGYVKYFRQPRLGSLLWQFFAFAFAFATFTSGFALFAERRMTWNGKPFGPREVGFMFAYSGFLGILLQGGLIGRLVKRYGEARLARVAFGAATVSYGLLGFVSRVPQLVGVATLSSFGTGTLRPTLTAEITQQSDRREQGVVLGITQSLMSVAQITAPIIGTFLIGRGQLAAWALVAALSTAIGLALSLSAGAGAPERAGDTAA